MNKKIGFACKFSSIDPIKGVVSIPEYNTGSTTVSWLNKQEKKEAEYRLWYLLEKNIQSVKMLVEKIGTLNENLRFVRLSSDILPMYTEPIWKYFYRLHDVRTYCERGFNEIGVLARTNNVRLSFHPGQFCCLGSDNPDVVNNSLEEFEYHADMVRWMGFGQKFQDFKINVHASGRLGPLGVLRSLKRLSPEARNCITIENDEISWGLNDVLTLTKYVPIVLDLHHHFIYSGEYIEKTDNRIKKIIDSWRGVRPIIHFSTSREDVLVEHPGHILPDLCSLLNEGHKKSKLRAHSDYCWNTAVNNWALTHLEWADIMVEAKSKNLASFFLAKYAEDLNLL